MYKSAFTEEPAAVRSREAASYGSGNRPDEEIYKYAFTEEERMIRLVDFDAEKEISGIVAYIREWFQNNGDKAYAVIGISGGKDSTIVAALLVKALGKGRVYGVLMPDGEQHDIQDSSEIVDILGIQHSIINIHPAVEGLLSALEAYSAAGKLSEDTRINIPPRIRMTTLYAVAQSLPGGGRVINTCNRSEDYIGYSTKYGDSAGDVSPCAQYTVSEMLTIGDALGLPGHLVHKTPSDGLCGQTDEDKIGFSYDTLDRYILTGECEDKEVKDKIDRMHRLNLHKLNPLPVYQRV